ncbi:MAG TPA: acyl carrier protein [Opitutaceae bacterium]|nr:acyl carrier protein [Opitutaceae bacterium]
MENSVPTPADPGASGPPMDKLRHLPAPARAAFERFQADGDVAALDPVVFAILEDYIPQSPDRALSEFPPHTRLIEDLGFDSLAITELVFFTEDLFGITIANEEILRVRTIDDLRLFVRRKVTGRPMAA